MSNNETITAISERVDFIEEKVQKIELTEKYEVLQKEWNTSVTRISISAIFSFMVVAIVMYLLDLNNYILGGFLAALGFVMTNFTLPIIRKFWIRRHLESEKLDQGHSAREVR